MAWEFDWPGFLTQHGVPYVTRGKNVARGHIAIRCPFCGQADPSQHMGISLHGQGWGCLRNRDHRGKSGARLIQGILGCDWKEAFRLAGEEESGAAVFAGPGNTFASQLNSLFQSPTTPSATVANKSLTLPRDFRAFRGNDDPLEHPYAIHLLRRRRLTVEQIKTVTRNWGLFYAITGRYGGRIIFTLYHDSRLIAWTGRAISDHVQARYKAIPRENSERYPAPLPTAVVSHHLLWHTKLRKAVEAGILHTLVLCEGPFDSLKINLLGWQHGIGSTCFFTGAPTEEQRILLHDLAPRFQRRYMVLDREAELMTLQIMPRLRGLDIQACYLTARKDPDGLRSLSELENLLASAA